jgi:hypothetical protein
VALLPKETSGLYLPFKIVFQMPEHLLPAVPALDDQLGAGKPRVFDDDDAMAPPFDRDGHSDVRAIVVTSQPGGWSASWPGTYRFRQRSEVQIRIGPIHLRPGLDVRKAAASS